MAHLGLVGLGVMGRNLALNLADHGVQVVGFGPGSSPDALPRGTRAASQAAMVAALPAPRIVLLLVPAGEAVDQQVAALAGLLAPGDTVVDGGNSHFRDTRRRAEFMAGHGIAFLGMGVSGGAEGARRGPALMADQPLPALAELFTPIAARADGAACFGAFGGSGAGHFVKMVHNGIEYADMQLIAEAVHLLRHGAGLEPPAIAALFRDWNRGELGSYLMEVTAAVLDAREGDTPFIDLIVDEAGQKGTGHWAVTAAMELGVPVPSLSVAVEARNLSGQRPVRAALARPRLPAEIRPEWVHDALLAGRIAAYAQGFSVLAAAKAAYWPELDMALAAGVWRGGCIIRSKLLEPIRAALAEAPSLPSLLLAPALEARMAEAALGLRRATTAALAAALPVPGLAAALSYWDGLGAPRLWADVVQAQRDYFGAHGFRRADRDGVQHGPWGGEQ
jgi:6-phosphogluconate dehydrogenase